MIDPLFQPFRVGTLTVPNRIVMAPMSQARASDGCLDPRYASYFRRRAEGESGLIISGTTAIDHPEAPFDLSEPHFHGAGLDGWRAVVGEVHRVGGRIVPQIGHAGLQGLAATPPPWAGLGPSGVWMAGAQIETAPIEAETSLEPITLDQIGAVIAAFAKAASTAKDLGFDGVEIHGGHGFLIDQFLWSRTNRRDDAYGKERTRFAAEIIAACRGAVGPDFPIFMRFSQFKMTDYGARLAETPGELEAVLRPLADAGVDLFDCSQRRFWRPEFPDSTLNLAGWVKKLSGRPTIGGGSVGLDESSLEYGATGVYGHVADTSVSRLDELRERLARGEFDLVSIGRAILGDPAWARKVRTGTTHELRPYGPETLMSLE